MASSSRQEKGKCVAFQVKNPSKKSSLKAQVTSSSKEKGNGVAFSVETPDFFKVVLDEALHPPGRLEIEGYVAAKFESVIAEELLLKVPNGEVWPVKWTRGGETNSLWLEKGWLEFANFYSLEDGYFLFFSFEGHSCFKVRIFKKRNVEIEYPFISSHQEEPKLDLEFGYSLHDEAFLKASSFKSKRPVLAVKLHPSYILSPLKIKESFVYEHIFQGYRSRIVKLQIPNGGTWSAKCTVSVCGRNDYARLHGGWTKFARANHLKEGDAIVLELMEKRPEVTLKVHIFRS